MTATSEPNPLLDLVLTPPPTAYVPILAAFHDGPKSWVAWCSFCRRWHTHGPGNGHRSHHCDEMRRGYHRDPQPVTHWAYGYVLSDDHAHADERRITYRPRLLPLGWDLISVGRALT
jgi:hypothetical protein